MPLKAARNGLLLWIISSCSPFVTLGFTIRPRISTATIKSTSTYQCDDTVFSSSFPSLLSMSSDGGDSSGMDEMRRLLESSWNTDQMGKLPTTPIDAANEAGGSLLTAKQRGLDLVLINLLLPSYDITMGSNLYDEVEAVTFCVALSEFLEGKASIVVRDNKTVHAVNRILEARAQQEEEEAAAAAAARANLMKVEEMQQDEDEEDDEEEGEEEDEGENKDDNTIIDDTEEEGGNKAAELDDFRKQLMMDWGEEEEEDTMSSTAEVEDPTPPPPVEKEVSMEPEAMDFANDMLNPAPKPKNYRLTSMFGDATFKPGPDMFDKVIQAVSANGQPKEDEDTIVILSANSEEETIGIRALVAKYKQSKTIVLVNCQMNPIPRELLKAETIYSLLPLIAKPKDSDAVDAPSTSQPKVIVLRRYPRDFEVFMDFGNGFDLTETVTTAQVGRTGPSMEWIVERVRRQMDARLF